jgi:hypothetical protein
LGFLEWSVHFIEHRPILRHRERSSKRLASDFVRGQIALSTGVHGTQGTAASLQPSSGVRETGVGNQRWRKDPCLQSPHSDRPNVTWSPRMSSYYRQARCGFTWRTAFVGARPATRRERRRLQPSAAGFVYRVPTSSRYIASCRYSIPSP